MSTIEDRYAVAIAAMAGVLSAALMTLALLATEDVDAATTPSTHTVAEVAHGAN